MLSLIGLLLLGVAIANGQDFGDSSPSPFEAKIRDRLRGPNFTNNKPIVIRLPRPSRPPPNRAPTSDKVPDSGSDTAQSLGRRVILPDGQQGGSAPVVPATGFGSGLAPPSGPPFSSGFGNFGSGPGPFDGSSGLDLPKSQPPPSIISPPAPQVPAPVAPAISAPAPASAVNLQQLPQLPNLTPQIKEILGIAGFGSEPRLPGGPATPELPAGLAGQLPNLAALGGQLGPSLSQLASSGLLGGGLPTNPGLPAATAFGSGLPIQPSFGGGAGFPPSPFGGGPIGLNSPQLPLPAEPTGNDGILGIFGTLARQLTRTSGIQNILQSDSGVSGNGLGPLPLPGIPTGGPGGPVLGVPSIPGLPLLPGGLPRNVNGQVDIVSLISAISRRVTNGTSIADVFPPDRLQGFADNLTENLLPETADVDLSKFMGRWFEGINSPRATDQRCIVHHYGGLTENGKTATFTALKIYREGSEFGQVRYSIGYAFRGGHRSAMLQMHSSEAADPMPYWIYKLGPEGKDPFGNPQYEYAVVSNWVRYPVMVLVRDPDKFKSEYESSVLRWLEDKQFINGFIRAFNLLQPVSYENCQYSSSTFEVFG